MLGGSIAIYVIMAACSAGSGPGLTLSNDGGTTSSSSSGGDGSGGVLDALTDPVGSAKADPTQSGTRLKVKYYAGSDGSQQVSLMHDSQRNEDCSFQLAADGNIRCLPSGAEAYVYFADSGCSQHLAIVVNSSCTTPPTYGLTYDTATCSGTPVHLFGVTGAYSGSTVYVE